jgi:tetratricopeptide (TPR) repeat protein
MCGGGNDAHFSKDVLAVTHMGEREWMFEYPRLTWEAMDKFHEALEYWRAGDYAVAEGMYHELIADFPEFIDVHHHLALILSVTGREEEAFLMWFKLVEMSLDCLPEAFEMGQDRLQWFILENRPFLRAYHSLGLQYLERGDVVRALKVFNSILAMNPGDNQGVRALAIDCYFHLDCPGDVLAICDQFADDGMEHVVYGRPLALVQLGRRDEAKDALQQAVAFLPLIAKELVKTRHRKPKDLREDSVTFGGADQAYYYWLDQGRYWKRTPGALELVRECLRTLDG